MGNGLDVVASELARDVEEFRRAEAQLRRRLAAARQPNETDRSAMRIIASAPVDAPVTPGELAAQLGVSTAAVTSVVRRLAERGQVVVAVHPDDARSKIIRPSLRDLHSPADEISRRIERVEREFAPEQLAAISLFLRRLARELEGIE
ncbi:MarR family transcriptional regulator [Microbacterium sp. KKR3/1]|uniref:MarR family winged helix-turn-helix transcriptional regulator n=1 Tax=unclassified Microbacterium TaxID=2609290 RepID=UPI00103D8BF8|nr:MULTISPECIES: MarR family transcriptional regulator [unclassified Microbacterium]MCE0509325.1 MarR family transcriptional regulator [Microbacterium sp. KKR3/1]TCJ22652.1 MarR family transcriptional regulator [Microbacterium sp. PI-1]